MDKVAELKKKPKKTLAIDYCAYTNLTNKEVAVKVGVSEASINKWKQDPNFIDAVYEKYMLKFGLEIPNILDAVVREAVSGNMVAARLALEHSGKLVKNINITVDSPFEKFLKAVPDAEVVEDAEIVDVGTFEHLPERKVQNPAKVYKKDQVATKEAIKKAERNAQQKVWYQWRKRAKAVGVEPLTSRRPTPAQRKEWEEKLLRQKWVKGSSFVSLRKIRTKRNTISLQNQLIPIKPISFLPKTSQISS